MGAGGLPVGPVDSRLARSSSRVLVERDDHDLRRRARRDGTGLDGGPRPARAEVVKDYTALSKQVEVLDGWEGAARPTASAWRDCSTGPCRSSTASRRWRTARPHLLPGGDYENATIDAMHGAATRIRTRLHEAHYAVNLQDLDYSDHGDKPGSTPGSSSTWPLDRTMGTLHGHWTGDAATEQVDAHRRGPGGRDAGRLSRAASLRRPHRGTPTTRTPPHTNVAMWRQVRG